MGTQELGASTPPTTLPFLRPQAHRVEEFADLQIRPYWTASSYDHPHGWGRSATRSLRPTLSPDAVRLSELLVSVGEADVDRLTSQAGLTDDRAARALTEVVQLGMLVLFGGATPPNKRQVDQARSAILQWDDTADLTVERGAPGLPALRRTAAVLLSAMLSAMGVLASAISILVAGLWALDSRSELATLSAIGADRATLRRVGASGAAGLTGVATICGVGVGALALSTLRASSQAPISLLPLVSVLGVGVVASVFAGAVARLATRRLVLTRRLL